MKAGSAAYLRCFCNLSVAAALAAALLPSLAHAVEWRQLTRTERHNVALAMDSVRLNANARLVVWLRFTPRGERQRREAAAEYGQKEYRLHLENYEIDCSEKTFVMGMIDIMGNGGRRLARQKGNGKLDVIPPGSVLDLAALRVCPELDEAASDSDEAPDTSADAVQPAAESRLPQETQQLIETARRHAESSPDESSAWTMLGNAYFDADMPNEAIEAYGRSLAIKPNDSDVLNDQGAMYRQVGDFAHALENFEKALANDPGNLESLYNLGYVNAFDLNRMDLALDIWKRYLAADKSSERASQVQSFMQRYSNKPPAQ